MSASRRDFLQNAMMSGAFAPFLGTASGKRLFEGLLKVANQPEVAPIGAHDSQKFWDNFGVSVNQPTEAAGSRTRGLFSHKKPDAGTAALGRQIDFFHYDPKENNLRFATSIDQKELLDYHGDVTASLAVNGLRMAAEDRAQFDQLQSAQLRIDVVQSKSLIQDLLDPMAWTSLAGLFPDGSGKLPPMQNLTFDPGAASQRMKQVLDSGRSTFPWRTSNPPFAPCCRR
jgi:hypothetical protein